VLRKLFFKIPQPYRLIAIVAALVLVAALLVFGYNSCRSGYVDRQSERHDARTEERSERERQLEVENARLRAQADESVKAGEAKDIEIAALKGLIEKKGGQIEREQERLENELQQIKSQEGSCGRLPSVDEQRRCVLSKLGVK
jgi:TolA-binding protein